MGGSRGLGCGGKIEGVVGVRAGGGWRAGWARKQGVEGEVEVGVEENIGIVGGILEER